MANTRRLHIEQKIAKLVTDQLLHVDEDYDNSEAVEWTVRRIRHTIRYYWPESTYDHQS